MATATFASKLKDLIVALGFSAMALAAVALLVDATIPPAKQELVCGRTGISVMVGADGITCQIRSTSRIYGQVGHTHYSYNGRVADGMEQVDITTMPRVNP